MNKLLIEDIRSLELPLGEYAVIGGAVLAVHGIRTYGDIDILVRKGLYDELKEKGWTERKIESPGTCADFLVLQKDHYEVFTLHGFDSQHYNCEVEYKPDNKTLIANADIINGIPFITLEDLRVFKLAYGREKDKQDIKLIDDYLERAKNLYYRTEVGV